MGSLALLAMSVSMVMSVMGTTAELGRDELRSGVHVRVRMQGRSGEVPKTRSPSRARKTLNCIEGSSRTPNGGFLCPILRHLLHDHQDVDLVPGGGIAPGIGVE